MSDAPATVATGFWRSVFSDGGEGSWSRIQTALHAGAVLAWITGFLYHAHFGTLPDITTLGGLSAFSIAPYAAGRAADAVSNFGNKG